MFITQLLQIQNGQTLVLNTRHIIAARYQPDGLVIANAHLVILTTAADSSLDQPHPHEIQFIGVDAQSVWEKLNEAIADGLA